MIERKPLRAGFQPSAISAQLSAKKSAIRNPKHQISRCQVSGVRCQGRETQKLKPEFCILTPDSLPYAPCPMTAKRNDPMTAKPSDAKLDQSEALAASYSPGLFFLAFYQSIKR
jgi:hypothetical protein